MEHASAAKQRPWSLTSLFGSSFEDKQDLCVTLGNAVGGQNIGHFVTCHLKTILQYYGDGHCDPRRGDSGASAR
jgi:hypothetical protein